MFKETSINTWLLVVQVYYIFSRDIEELGVVGWSGGKQRSPSLKYLEL